MTARRVVAAQREVSWQTADPLAAHPAPTVATRITPSASSVGTPVATAHAPQITVQQITVQQITVQQITWGELGCPKDIGLYRAAAGLQNFHGNVQIRVKRIHVIVAENDPAALFTVLALRPPLGPPEFILGHRLA